MDRQKFKLTLAYDGAAYHGWQTQKTGVGVQQIVEQALARLFPSQPKLQGSSRTDTGVHALGMVADFEIPSPESRMSPDKLALALNAHLPEDIRVMKAARARNNFHARFDASGKQYRYHIWCARAMNPLLRRQAWHVPQPTDIRLMRSAARHFVGRHDFQSFTANPGYARASTIRTLTRCAVLRRGPLLTVIMEGDGFLYKMCRGIVGTIVQAGTGKFPPDEIKTMLAHKDRRVAGMNAPAHGLVLWKVFYRGKRGAAPPPKAA